MGRSREQSFTPAAGLADNRSGADRRSQHRAPVLRNDGIDNFLQRRKDRFKHWKDCHNDRNKVIPDIRVQKLAPSDKLSAFERLPRNAREGDRAHQKPRALLRYFA